MSLTMHTHRNSSGIITNYTIVGGGADREELIAALAFALHNMVPTGTTCGLSVESRNAMASVSLQVAALLADGNDDTPVREQSKQALFAIRHYLLHVCKRFMDEQKLDAKKAQQVLIPSYAYFDYPWDELTGEVAI
jgi:hypothetical protein